MSQRKKSDLKRSDIKISDMKISEIKIPTLKINIPRIHRNPKNSHSSKISSILSISNTLLIFTIISTIPIECRHYRSQQASNPDLDQSGLFNIRTVSKQCGNLIFTIDKDSFDYSAFKKLFPTASV